MDSATCIECLGPVGEIEGWETTSGKVMCSGCFDEPTSPGAWTLASLAAPPRRSKPRGFVWLTGPNGEVIETHAFRIVSGGRSA